VHALPAVDDPLEPKTTGVREENAVCSVQLQWEMVELEVLALVDA
jgi:hypothetical protein